MSFEQWRYSSMYLTPCNVRSDTRSLLFTLKENSLIHMKSEAWVSFLLFSDLFVVYLTTP
jgi:hypothetical protein